MMQKTKTPAKTDSGLSTEEKAKLIAGWLHEKKGVDVIAMDVRGICPITEALVVVTATSGRHAAGMADALLDKVAEERLEYLGMEGKAVGDWILVDLNDVLVHIFRENNRDFYDIEGLWSEGKRIPLDLHD